MGIGAVLCDHHGSFISGYTATLNSLFSSAKVEAITLKEVLSWLKAGNHSNVVLEKDAQVVVHNIL